MIIWWIFIFNACLRNLSQKLFVEFFCKKSSVGDPDPDSDPDLAVFVSDIQNIN